MMKTHRLATFIVLLGLLGLAAVGLVLTREWVNPSLRENLAQLNATGQAPLVDQQPLVTAQDLVALAAAPEEQEFAEEALQLADHDVDLAFASALRKAEEHSIPLTPEARQLHARVKQAEARVNAHQDEITRLTKVVVGARGEQKESLEGQLQLAQAQLALDQDELADAQRDLSRTGGDEHSRVKRLLDEHERSLAHLSTNASRASASAVGQASKQANAPSLVAELRGWTEMRAKLERLRQAQQDARARAAVLIRSHDSIERGIKQKQSQDTPLAQQAAGQLAAASGPSQGTAPALSSVHHFSQDQHDLADLDKRIEAEQKLAAVYGKWSGLVRTRELASLHRLIQSGFWIVSIVLLTFLADSFVYRFFSDLAPNRKRLRTARSVLHFSMRALGLVLVLLVLFGPPSQLAAILALAGAGLTVALKDFIVGFFGWFVLMGRNGVRSGDWVEINGVQGKVIEVGLLHTVILETGNWTDAGHPTGRKVSFVNSFAVEGHYFNFSTVGQWLWDEIQVGLPSGTDPYPTVEAIQKLVAAETEADARLAEQEWQRATTTSGLRSFSAAPTISVRPTHSGLNLIVRYIARADERNELRSRLYRAAYEFLIGKGVLQPTTESRTRQSTAGVG